MDPAVTCLIVLVAAVALFLWNRLPVGVVAIATTLSLYLTGLLDAGEALSGFGDQVVIFVAALFVVSEALDATGITAWAGDRLTELTGAGRKVLIASVMGVAAVLTAVISPNGSVAALLPVVMAVAVRGNHPPSQIVLPLAFAAHAGSLLALSGSPVNILVSEAAADATGTPFGFFEFAILGVPLLAATVAISVFLGPRLLPMEGTGRPPPDLSRHAHTLSRHYALHDGFYRLTVQAGSPVIGKPMPRETVPVTVIGVQSADGTVPPQDRPLAVGDTVVVTGSTTDVNAVALSQHLSIEFRPLTADTLLSNDTGVV
jgi:Na+/H+ antiporter NhaD/arsenite permease-like protein